jgi:hypothetical protein
MKITKSQLRQIIREEISLAEQVTSLDDSNLDIEQLTSAITSDIVNKMFMAAGDDKNSLNVSGHHSALSPKMQSEIGYMISESGLPHRVRRVVERIVRGALEAENKPRLRDKALKGDYAPFFKPEDVDKY